MLTSAKENYENFFINFPPSQNNLLRTRLNKVLCATRSCLLYFHGSCSKGTFCFFPYKSTSLTVILKLSKVISTKTWFWLRSRDLYQVLQDHVFCMEVVASKLTSINAISSITSCSLWSRDLYEIIVLWNLYIACIYILSSSML